MQNPIQLVNIDDQLQKLWNEELGKSKVRACLFNLVIYARKTERASFCQNIIQSVISKFPCRVILIVNEERAKEDYLKTSVSTETVSAGELKIFCEIIQIEVGGSLIERVPFIVLPHLLPDLPVYLLWTQDPVTESAVLPHLERFADRIIFDSTITLDLQKFADAILSLMSRFQCEIGDLNWSALGGWRRLLSKTFDTPQSLLALTQAKEISIIYNFDRQEFQKNAEIKAVYLQAWIASQLNWKFEAIEKTENRSKIRYRRGSQEVIFDLQPQEESELPVAKILAIEIESLHKKSHLIFKRHPNTQQVFIQYEDAERCELPHVAFLSSSNIGHEIVEEIFNLQTSTHYRNMLQILSQIPWGKSE